MRKQPLKRIKPSPYVSGNTEQLIGQDVRDILTEKGGQVEKTKQELKEEARRRKRRTRPYFVIAYAFVFIFVALIGYLVYFNVMLKDDILSSPYNKRQNALAEYVIRGEITDTEGRVLAETRTAEDGSESRSYPYGRLLAHAVGYDVRGKSGLESVENYTLLSADNAITDRILNDLLGQKNPGDTVVSTLDVDIQKAAYEALGGYNGAVIAVEPATGAVRAWVSKPDFDPNTLNDDWEALVSDSGNSNLVNRVSQGRYTPGSVFKIVTALAYYRTFGSFDDFHYHCTGEITEDGHAIHCAGGAVHGDLDAAGAFAQSCNCAFVAMGQAVGADQLKKTAESLLFNAELYSQLTANTSSFALDSESDTMELMQTSFGQGRTTMSPYHLALIVSAIANDGILMKPTLIQRIDNDSGDTVKTIGPTAYTRLMTEEEAAVLKTFMTGVVKEGTGAALGGRGYEAAGKTGTADTVNGDGSAGTNAWFVGILDPADPSLVVAVVVENGGSGAGAALPVCAAVFDAYHEKYGG